MPPSRDSFSDSAVFGPPRPGCPLCDDTRITPLYTIARYSPPFRVDRCSSCGFIFQNPPFSEQTINGFYGDAYYEGGAEYSYHDERASERFSAYVWDRRLRVIRRHVRGGNFLDVGCAFGGLLARAARHFTPFGIELSEYSASHARKAFGDHIHTGTLADHPFPGDFFSVITMIEVLEHLPDPAGAVRECRRLLKENGLLVLQTANMDGLQARVQKDRYAYFMPGHLSYFSKRNLTGLLKEAGFRRVIVYHPVEFGLLPKLQKSRHTFKKLSDYKSWPRIALYHCLSKVRLGSFSLTSSMVIYAFK